MNTLFSTPISTSNLHAPNFDKLCSIIAEATSEDGFLQVGSVVAQLEQRLCTYHDADYCVAFSTGFWALVASVCAKAIPGRTEVIIPSMTYRRLADVVFWTGHTPVFVDIEPDNLSICPMAVEEAISENTAMILGVHPIVNCCDAARLIAISEEHAVPIIFDAVESVHETIAGKRVGSFGVGEVFSLHASKLINGFEGGYVCTNEPELKDSLLRLRDGSHHTATSGNLLTDDSKQSGTRVINGQPNDVHAAVALAELDEIVSIVDHNRSIYDRYCDELEDVTGIELLRFDDTQQSSFKNVVARVLPSFPVQRDELVTLLNDLDILARPHYYPALHSKSYQYPVRICDMHVSNELMLQYINLPCGSRVTDEDVKTVCGLLRSLASE